MTIHNATFVYRGQLDVERSRIEFLLSAACEAFAHVDVVLLSPGPGVSVAGWQAFAQGFSNVRNCSFVEAPIRSALSVRRTLRTVVAPDAAHIVAVGFSVAGFLPQRRCLAWAVNGIPEERLLHNSNLANRLAARASWAVARRLDADVIVVVSEPMSRLVVERIGGTTLVIPNAVDRSVFAARSDAPRTWLTYQGGGSPWQGLDRLAKVWGALHRADPDLRFRVITRDPRANRLADEIPSSVVEFCSADGHDAVAAHLAEARLGFLIRRPGIVNEVSWPMKLGEYLAMGVPVAVSRCGWDAERLVARHDAGVIVDSDRPVEHVADQIITYLREIGSSTPPGVEHAAAELGAAMWTDRLERELTAAIRRADEMQDLHDC